MGGWGWFCSLTLYGVLVLLLQNLHPLTVELLLVLLLCFLLAPQLLHLKIQTQTSALDSPETRSDPDLGWVCDQDLIQTHLLLHQQAAPVCLLLVHLVDFVPLGLVETPQPQTEPEHLIYNNCWRTQRLNSRVVWTGSEPNTVVGLQFSVNLVSVSRCSGTRTPTRAQVLMRIVLGFDHFAAGDVTTNINVFY